MSHQDDISISEDGTMTVVFQFPVGMSHQDDTAGACLREVGVKFQFPVGMSHQDDSAPAWAARGVILRFSSP